MLKNIIWHDLILESLQSNNFFFWYDPWDELIIRL